MKPMRQGDVILIPGWNVASAQLLRCSDLVLAQGEVTGHRHQITQGEAELFKYQETLYLRVISEYALLTHEEHNPLKIAQGDWTVRIQREYEPAGWRYIVD
jgi:hypothetical protein